MPRLHLVQAPAIPANCWRIPAITSKTSKVVRQYTLRPMSFSKMESGGTAAPVAAAAPMPSPSAPPAAAAARACWLLHNSACNRS